MQNSCHYLYWESSFNWRGRTVTVSKWVNIERTYKMISDNFCHYYIDNFCRRRTVCSNNLNHVTWYKLNFFILQSENEMPNLSHLPLPTSIDAFILTSPDPTWLTGHAWREEDTVYAEFHHLPSAIKVGNKMIMNFI